MTARLHGRALVTGGTSGIGLGFARRLALAGLDVVLVARDPGRLESTAAELTALGVEVETIVADLATREGTDVVGERLTDEERPVEVYVANAGHGLYEPLATEDTAPHHAAIDLMIRAVLDTGAAAARAMTARGHGVIIPIGSISGTIATGHYSAIKAWTNSWAESLATELEGTGVTVTCVMPGWVRTEFHQRAGMSTGKIPDALWLDPDQVVVEALDAAERGDYRVVPSWRYKIIAFAAEKGPKAAVRAVSRVIQGGRR
ncbi:SDR family NAD(P)-dependent oxidoreductase [Georgenia sp. Z1344]|uniref:SDR family NAD(P)-dependent oxidoreductase n=1 Tax=Georgenia sp. Z1344 TaxID=3416706 RepID=UPI003CE85EB0